MTAFQTSMVSVPSLQPVDDATAAELAAFFKQVEEVVVPQIVEDVKRRLRGAEEARKLVLFG